MREADETRSEKINITVRRAVGRLPALERVVIEDYYFDGMSFDRIAAGEDMLKTRVVLAHRRALASLRASLAGFVEEMFGIVNVPKPDCPICAAGWRHDAEAILDSKTPDVTWGELMVRIERACGWRAHSPKTLVIHQRDHRQFTRSDTEAQS